MESTLENIKNGLKGYSRIRRFPNGYGLSIISHSFSYGGTDGLFEIALLDDKDDIIYDESLGFSDVKGHLDFEAVALIIQAVASLPARH